MAEPLKNPNKVRPADIFNDKNRPKRSDEKLKFHSLSDVLKPPTPKSIKPQPSDVF